MKTPNTNRPPRSLKSLNAAINATPGLAGYELVRGSGYYYVIGAGEAGDAAGWPSTSIHVTRLGAWSCATWIAAVQELADEAQY